MTTIQNIVAFIYTSRQGFRQPASHLLRGRFFKITAYFSVHSLQAIYEAEQSFPSFQYRVRKFTELQKWDNEVNIVLFFPLFLFPNFPNFTNHISYWLTVFYLPIPPKPSLTSTKAPKVGPLTPTVRGIASRTQWCLLHHVAPRRKDTLKIWTPTSTISASTPVSRYYC